MRLNIPKLCRAVPAVLRSDERGKNALGEAHVQPHNTNAHGHSAAAAEAERQVRYDKKRSR